MKGEKLLRNIFIALMILLFWLIVSTPILINTDIVLLDEPIKEIVEAGMLFVLVSVGARIYFLYKKRLKRREKELDETHSYIGAVHPQVDQIKTMIEMLTRYRE